LTFHSAATGQGTCTAPFLNNIHNKKRDCTTIIGKVHFSLHATMLHGDRYCPLRVQLLICRAGVRQLAALFIVFKGGSSSGRPGVHPPENC